MLPRALLLPTSHNWSANVLLILQALLVLTSPGFPREVSLFT